VQIGDLVQLLDVYGKPHQTPTIIGTVMGFNKHGRIRVHWQNIPNTDGGAWPWGRLKVVNASR